MFIRLLEHQRRNSVWTVVASRIKLFIVNLPKFVSNASRRCAREWGSGSEEGVKRYEQITWESVAVKSEWNICIWPENAKIWI